MNNYKIGDEVRIVGSKTIHLWANSYIGEKFIISKIQPLIDNPNRKYNIKIDGHCLRLCGDEIEPNIKIGEQLLFSFMKK